jgi:hypothetical protein
MMRKIGICVAIISAALLAGCATPFRDYEGTAKRVAVANLCEREGMISSEAFSYYSSYQFGEYAQQWEVDKQRLQSMYFDELKRLEYWKPQTSMDKEQLKLRCGEITTVAQRVRPGNRAPTQQPEFIFKAPSTTNCFTTNGWTRCTTN